MDNLIKRNICSEWKRIFSLVELLVIIAIISILMSMLMPALKKAKDTATQALCASNLKQVGATLSMYDMENGCSPTLRRTATSAVRIYFKEHPVWDGTNVKTIRWERDVGYFVDVPEIFYCPEIAGRDAFLPLMHHDFTIHHYGGNNRIMSEKGEDGNPSYSLAFIRSPSKMTLFLEGNSYSCAEKQQIIYPHKKRANNLFVDGHVESLILTDLNDLPQFYYLKWPDLTKYY